MLKNDEHPSSLERWLYMGILTEEEAGITLSDKRKYEIEKHCNNCTTCQFFDAFAVNSVAEGDAERNQEKRFSPKS